MVTLLSQTPYSHINQALAEYIAALHAQFETDLTAVYLLGSLTTDDYVPDWSDVDGLVVLARRGLDTEGKVEAAHGVKDPHPFDRLRASSNPLPEGEGTRIIPTLFTTAYTVSELRQPDWRTNPLGMVNMLALMEHGRLVWGTDIRHLLIVPSYPSVRAYVVNDLARLIRQQPRELPVRIPRGVGGKAYAGRSQEIVGWLFYIARTLQLLETGQSGSKASAVAHYLAHHHDHWQVWLRWAEAYRYLEGRPPLTSSERRALALAVQDFFWEVVNYVLLGLGHDPETLTTDEAVLAALDGWLRAA
jgi:hypothetical protein